MTELTALTASELLSSYAAREVSPVEVTRAVLERIERVDPLINAFCVVDADRAMDHAAQSEERWQQGAP